MINYIFIFHYILLKWLKIGNISVYVHKLLHHCYDQNEKDDLLLT